MSLFHDFAHLFFPRYCLGCKGPVVKGEDTFCTQCLTQLPKTNFHLHDENSVKRRLAGRLPLTHGFAFLHFQKGGLVQNLLHALKYHNHPEVGVYLGKIYGRDLAEAGFATTFDLIVPVPLHETRRRRRGYNQSARFAEGLGETLQVPWHESISLRKQATVTQTRKTRAERWQNVSEAFSIALPEQIEGRHVLLVDDVITTGATLEACGQHLLNSGCAQLSVACIAEA